MIFNFRNFFSVFSGTVFSFISTSVYAQTSVAVDLPASSGSCDKAVTSVSDELAEKGYFIPWQTPAPQSYSIEPRVEVSDEVIPINYYNYPAERTRAITFHLSGDFDKINFGLFSSPQFMATLSAQIMASCEQVGLVEFSDWWESSVPVGYFSDNTARPFQWVDINPNGGPHQRTAETSLGPTLQYEWGYFFAP